jgi:hypothetical protein
MLRWCHMLVDHPLISRRVFFPRPSNLEPTCTVEVGETRLACYSFRRHPQAGMILHFHGNGELAAEYAADSAQFFLCLGINVCFAEYRGYGASTGTPGLGAMLGDGCPEVKKGCRESWSDVLPQLCCREAGEVRDVRCGDNSWESKCQCLGRENHVAIQCSISGCLLTRISRLRPQICGTPDGRCIKGKIFEPSSVHVQQRQSRVALNPIQFSSNFVIRNFRKDDSATGLQQVDNP